MRKLGLTLGMFSLAVSLVCGTVMLCSADPTPGPPRPLNPLQPAVLNRVIDGDTIVVNLPGQGGKDAALHVRLFDVNCAELKEGRSGAFRAALYTATALERGIIYLTPSPKSAILG